MKPFKTDNMTAQDILNMNIDDLIKLDKRETSRALRTLALVANKRIKRLKENAKKTKDGYVSKQGKRQISTDALNWVTNDGKKRSLFGVKKASSRNEMQAQIKKIRQFMQMSTSTVTGATNIRKEREKRLFGKTREQAARGTKTKKARAEIYNMFESKMRESWSNYRKFLESEGINPHATGVYGSENAISLIAQSTMENTFDENSTFEEASKILNEAYEEAQTEINNSLEGLDPYEYNP